METITTPNALAQDLSIYNGPNHFHSFHNMSDFPATNALIHQLSSNQPAVYVGSPSNLLYPYSNVYPFSSTNQHHISEHGSLHAFQYVNPTPSHNTTNINGHVPLHHNHYFDSHTTISSTIIN